MTHESSVEPQSAGTPVEPTGASDRPGRPLGYMESIHARTHELGGAIQFSIVARISGVLVRERALDAWRHLFAAHPALRSTLTGDTVEVLCDFRDAAIEFRAEDRVDWLAEMGRDLKTALPRTARPLWRATFILDGRGTHYLVFASHHAILDGIAAVSLVRQFIATYNVLSVGTGAALPGPFEALMAIESYLPTSFRTDRAPPPPPEKLWKVERLVPPTDREQLLIHCLYDAARLSRLLDACRLRGVRLTAPLAVATLLAFEATLAEKTPAASRPDRISIRIPRNVRPLSQRPFADDELGDFITMQSVSCSASRLSDVRRRHVPEDDLWTLARELTDQYMEQPVVPANHRSYLDATLDFVKQVEDSHFRHGPILSNLGRIPTETAPGPLKLRTFDAAIRNAPINSSVGIITASYEGQLSCLFNFNTPLVSRVTAHAFVDVFGSVIDKVVSEE